MAALVQDNLPMILFLGVFALVIGGIVLRRVRAHRAEAAFDELLAREEGWEETQDPVAFRDVGLGGIQPALTTHGLGRVKHAMTGPLTVEIAGRPVACEASCFYWFYTSEGSGGERGNRTQTPVATIRLPGHVPSRISVRREDLVSRLGAKHQGERFASAEFERRFRVVTEDGELAARLFDASLQQLLVDRFAGRRIELLGDGLLIAGESDAPDDTISSAWIAQLPAVREDLRLLVERIPTAFWAAVGVAHAAADAEPAPGQTVAPDAAEGTGPQG